MYWSCWSNQWHSGTGIASAKVTVLEAAPLFGEVHEFRSFPPDQSNLAIDWRRKTSSTTRPINGIQNSKSEDSKENPNVSCLFRAQGVADVIRDTLTTEELNMSK